MLLKRYCWFALALIFLVACGDLNAGSKDAAVPPQETIAPMDTISAPALTPTNAIPTSIPSPTSTATATSDAHDIAAATAIPLPEELQPPFPDSFLNLAGTQNPLFSCAESANLGQIWFSRYPYETVEQYAARENIGFYEPTLSPNGEWLVMVAVDIENLNETTQSNGSWRFYEDSIWLMRSDGSTEPQQISNEFVRAEFSSTENNSCAVTAGIERIVGWSPDGKWLAFIVSSPKENTYNADLYILNIETFEQATISSQVNTAIWIEDEDNSLIFTTFYTPATVMMANLNGADINFEEFSLPPRVSAQYQISVIQSEQSSHFAFFRGKERNAPFNAQFSFWHLDIYTGNWQALSKLEPSNSIHFVPNTNLALRCFEDSQSKIDVLDRTTWDMVGSIENVEGWRCGFRFFQDETDKEAVSFTNNIDRKSIWVSLVGRADSVPEKIIDVNNYEIPEGVEIVDYVWSQ